MERGLESHYLCDVLQSSVNNNTAPVGLYIIQTTFRHCIKGEYWSYLELEPIHYYQRLVYSFLNHFAMHAACN